MSAEPGIAYNLRMVCIFRGSNAKEHKAEFDALIRPLTRNPRADRGPVNTSTTDQKVIVEFTAQSKQEAWRAYLKTLTCLARA